MAKIEKQKSRNGGSKEYDSQEYKRKKERKNIWEKPQEIRVEEEEVEAVE